MKSIALIILALGVAGYTLHQDTKLNKIDSTKYNLSTSK